MKEKRNPFDEAQQQINVAKSNCEAIEGKTSSQSQQEATKTCSMTRLQKFSRIAAYLFVGILVVSVLLQLDVINYKLRFMFIFDSLSTIIRTIWFAFLLSSSSGKPFLRMVAIYGMLASLFSTFCELLRFDYYISPINCEPYPSESTIIISKAICLSAFLLLAHFFKRKSTLQILSICIATAPLILAIFIYLLLEFASYQIGWVYFIIRDGLYIAFMYYFFKMKT